MPNKSEVSYSYSIHVAKIDSIGATNPSANDLPSLTPNKGDRAQRSSGAGWADPLRESGSEEGSSSTRGRRGEGGRGEWLQLLLFVAGWYHQEARREELEEETRRPDEPRLAPSNFHFFWEEWGMDLKAVVSSSNVMYNLAIGLFLDPLHQDRRRSSEVLWFLLRRHRIASPSDLQIRINQINIS